jgi:Zn-dependent peptidase ImmA (M78 family)
VRGKDIFGRPSAPDWGGAAAAARRVLIELDVPDPRLGTIDTLADMRGLEVRDAAIQGTRANLVRLGKNGVVTVSSGLSTQARRFAIAHELGHFELHKEESYLGLCTGEQLVTDYESGGTEAEANAFAAEFLMPARLFKPRTQGREVSWDIPRRLADEFHVTLMAAALRFVELSDERVAVLFSVKGSVSWRRRSRDFGRLLDPGAKLDSYSLAIDAFNGKSLPSHVQTVETTAWKPDPRGDEVLKEHSLYLPNVGGVLTLLWAPVSR